MLNGKTIVVTGAGSGIGRTTSEVLAKAGAAVVVADIDEVGGAATATGIKAAGGEAVFRRCDVANEDDVEALIGFAVERYGKLDGGFNNAGIELYNKPVHELSGAEFRRVIDVDLVGVFYCVKHEFRAMMKTGGGSIVNTASSVSDRPLPVSTDYTSAKAGVVGLTKAAALDGGPLGIRVNAVCPGLILTPMTKDRLMNDPVFSQAVQGIRARHHIGRFGETIDIANAVSWLLSDLSSFVTGSEMMVDGGYSI
ncbi:MAG: glucose 1-dehydrogenase [Caulobacterales bacterium]